MADIGKAYLQIVPSMQGFGSQLQAGGTPGVSSAVGKWGGMMKATFAVAGVAAVAKGMKELVSIGAEYEQVAGGAKDVFNEIDYKVIQKDAGDAFKTMGMSAMDYNKMLSSTGAMFASTLGDEKGYEVAQRGMKGIADFSAGSGKSMDELTEKWGLINKGASSYQSIADQFAGILPATSKDFLDQAQKAGLLSDSYTKLTDVPTGEYQSALSEMVNIGNENMGWMGKTAEEGEKTVSGSFERMSNSWGNLLTSLSSGEDVDESMSEFGDSLLTWGENVLTMAGEIGSNIGTGLMTAYKKALNPEDVDSTMNVFKGVKDAWGNLKTTVGDSIGSIVKALGGSEKVTGAFKTVLSWIGKFIGTTLTVVFKSLGIAIKGVSAIIIGIINAFKWLYNKVKDLGTFLGGWFKDKWNDVKSAIDKVREIADKVKNVFGNVVQGVKDSFATALDWIKGKINNWIIKPINSVSGALNKILPGDPIGKIPLLANGGIVDRPTLAIIGEAGPEAVVPLNKYNVPGQGGGNTINITINSNGMDVNQLVRKIKDVVTYDLGLV